MSAQAAPTQDAMTRKRAEAESYRLFPERYYEQLKV